LPISWAESGVAKRLIRETPDRLLVCRGFSFVREKAKAALTLALSRRERGLTEVFGEIRRREIPR
jgi:hypothetical protein